MENPHRNYAKELDELILKIPKGEAPRLLLHSCCAPCSTYVLEYLSMHFSIQVLFFNPNIYPIEEYNRRLVELVRFLEQGKYLNQVSLIPHPYDSERFYDVVQGFEKEPEKGKRCHICYALRLEEAAKAAIKYGCDYFTTTLSISPMKDAAVLNQIGEDIGSEFGVRHLPCNFKKKEGYKRSIKLSTEFGLYRQDYCGCVFSKQSI